MCHHEDTKAARKIPIKFRVPAHFYAEAVAREKNIYLAAVHVFLVR
jgi:hypothetical protein